MHNDTGIVMVNYTRDGPKLRLSSTSELKWLPPFTIARAVAVCWPVPATALLSNPPDHEGPGGVRQWLHRGDLVEDKVLRQGKSPNSSGQTP